MYICENCDKEHDSSYGSGRFCSSKCARGFSTKAKRKEINEKVSKKLKKDIEYFTKICPICKNEFTKDSQTCSRICANTLLSIKNLGKIHKPIKDSSKMGGLRQGGGKAKQLPYINWLGYKMSLNKEEIEVAKVLDEKKLNWRRNTKGFTYVTEDGKQRKFYPDFVVDENKYIEYKGWVTSEMKWKMKDAVEKNNLNLTIIYSEDKRYRKLGLTLKEFEI